MTAMRSSQLSDAATTVDCVVRSSAAAAATRRSLGSSWGTRVSGTPRIRQLGMDSMATCFASFLQIFIFKRPYKACSLEKMWSFLSKTSHAQRTALHNYHVQLTAMHLT